MEGKLHPKIKSLNIIILWTSKGSRCVQQSELIGMEIDKRVLVQQIRNRIDN